MGSHLKNLFIMLILFMLAVMTAEAQEYLANQDEIITDHSLIVGNKILPEDINRSPAIEDSEALLEGALYDANQEAENYAEQNYPQNYEEESEAQPFEEENYSETDDAPLEQ